MNGMKSFGMDFKTFPGLRLNGLWDLIMGVEGELFTHNFNRLLYYSPLSSDYTYGQLTISINIDNHTNEGVIEINWDKKVYNGEITHRVNSNIINPPIIITNLIIGLNNISTRLFNKDSPESPSDYLYNSIVRSCEGGISITALLFHTIILLGEFTDRSLYSHQLKPMDELVIRILPIIENGDNVYFNNEYLKCSMEISSTYFNE
jgi:hypothetical protein